MNGFERAPLRLSVATAFCFVTTLGADARAAGVAVSIHYASEAEREVAERLVSELSSEGYSVEARAVDEPTPCDPNGAKVVSVGAEARAWIRLSEDPAGGETVVATICYLGALPFLQQASSSAPRSDPRKLALAAAEALNGLRSKVPPPAPEPTPTPANSTGGGAHHAADLAPKRRCGAREQRDARRCHAPQCAGFSARAGRDDGRDPRDHAVHGASHRCTLARRRRRGREPGT